MRWARNIEKCPEAISQVGLRHHLLPFGLLTSRQFTVLERPVGWRWSRVSVGIFPLTTAAICIIVNVDIVVVLWRRLAIIPAAKQTEHSQHGEVNEELNELKDTDDGTADPQPENAADVRYEIHHLWRTHMDAQQ